MVEFSDFYQHIYIKIIYRPHTNYRDLSLGLLEVVQKVSILFKDHPDLIEGFNSFLPGEWKFEVCCFY